MAWTATQCESEINIDITRTSVYNLRETAGSMQSLRVRAEVH